MGPVRRWRGLAAFAVLAIALMACGGRDTGGAGAGGGQVVADPGITDTEIKLGGSYPFSGPVSAAGTVGKGVEAYFKYVNEEKGGIKSADGKTRKVNWNMLDDAYTPARAVENIKRLVEQDKVFAIFNTLGTPNNTAVWDYLNQSEIPHVFVNTGASKFYGDKAHPWTTGGLVPYPIESTVYAEFLKKERPNAKVAVLYQNDDFGRDYLHGFENAIKGSGISIVARQSAEVTDPTVDSQVVNLASSGADVFFGIALDKQQAQALKKVHETG